MRILKSFSLLFLLLTACSSVRSGIVVDKWYEPPVDEWRYEYTCDWGIGGSQQCDFKNHWVHEDEEFMITLRSCELDTDECSETSWSIDQIEYKGLEIGDRYTVE